MTYPQPPHGQYPPQQWPPAPPAPKKRKWLRILGIAAAALVGLMVLGAIVGPQQPASTPAAGPRPATTEQPAQVAADQPAGSVVVYEVLGKGSAGNVTYMKEGFSQEQQTSAKLPWRKELQFKDQIGAFSPLSLVAQNGAKGGDITCRITVDGEIVGESTSSGQYAVVTCNGNG